MTAVIISLIVRFYQISDRPLHNDEAVNSVKLKYLLENGEFKYDPIEYHGPTLYYFSLLGSWISGNYKFHDLSEETLRGVNVVFTSLLFLFLFLYRKSLNRSDIIITSALLLVSPFLNFYSRYYIHESLFSLFTIMMIISYYRFFKSRKDIWAILTGIFAGLVFATKETSIIVFTGFFLALILTKSLKELKLKSVSLFAFSFVLISVIFYSSFFSNAEGIVDSVTTFKNYIIKSSANTDHIQPWYYYLSLFSFYDLKGFIISEFIIIIGAVIGMILSFKNEKDLIFQWLSIFSVLFFIVFSLIPYKTPWSIMAGWITIILLSGYGFAKFISLINNKKIKLAYNALLSIVFVYLAYQSYLTTFKYADHPENPFTYSQPTKAIYTLTDTVEDIIKYDKNTKIYVIAAEDQYWPLPWYFRESEFISWNSSPGEDLHRFEIIITEPEFIPEVTNILYTIPKPGKRDLYVPLLLEDVPIRPGKPLSSYIKNDFMVKYLNSESEDDNREE
ncbi:MAG: TIGR03663 family protein [Melioribacteraceae bacterium]|nr:TIGR03663 family protein [Melioribacteraceae bacterium]